MQNTTLNPYIIFNGNCKDAMNFYQSVLGGKLDMQTFGEAPGTDPAVKDRIVHASLISGGITLMASDSTPETVPAVGRNVQLSLVGTDEKALTDVFQKLSDGGKVVMKLEKQFWGDQFGMVDDKFGIAWMVNISAKKS